MSPGAAREDRPLSVLMAATSAYPDETGGRETYIYEISRALAGIGHEVTLVTGARRSGLAAEEWVEGVRFLRYRVDACNLVTLISSLVRGVRGKVRELLTSGACFDLINCDSPWAGRAVNSVRQSRRLLRVQTFHSPVRREVELLLRDSASASDGLGKKLLRPLYLSAYKRLAHRAEGEALHRSDAVITLSEYMKRLAGRYHRVAPSKVTVIPGGVDVGRFHPGGGRRRARQALGLPGEATILLTVRRLTARMGLDRLIAAMPRVAAEVPNLVLIIGGRGSLEGRLRRQAAELGVGGRVRFAGQIPADRLPDYYRSADLFVLPTRELEGFGLVTLEALACGTPAVGTAVGGTAEVLGGLGTENLLRADCPGALAAGIAAALRANARAPERAAAKCREYALRYAWPLVAERLAESYRALLARREAPEDSSALSPDRKRGRATWLEQTR